MKERPILFSAPMVRAILDGAKTQTRRVVKSPAKNMQDAGMEVIKHREPGDRWYKNHVWSMRGKNGVWGDYTQETFTALCPYGKPGDLLWVRETHAFVEPRSSGKLEYDGARMVGVGGWCAECWYRADGDLGPLSTMFDDGPRWRPSIHMPRWASRITLRVTSVRVERLQDITPEDAIAEGCTLVTVGGMHAYADTIGGHHPLPTQAYKALWCSINGAGSWDANPWVWVVGFERVQPQRAEDGHG